jgi:DinB superfamily
MSPEIKNLLDRFENGTTVFEDALRGVPPAVADRVPAPGKWSIRQIAAHLADAELVGAVRMRFIAAQPGSPLKAYDQDVWANELAYTKLPVEDSLAAFRAARKYTSTMLRNLPESAFTRTGMHEERGEESLQRLVELYCDHTDHHARQIRELRGKLAAA